MEINKLGNYKGVLICHDPHMKSDEILAGSEDKRVSYPSGYSPLKEYKKSIDLEPKISDNHNFRSLDKKDLKKKREIKWIVGGSDDISVYKDAINYIFETFNIKNSL